jgi:hypothetical protein
MADAKHDDHVLGLIDLVQHPPLAAQAGAVDPGQLRAKRLANPPRILQEGPVMNSATAVATSIGSPSVRARRAGGAVPSS